MSILQAQSITSRLGALFGINSWSLVDGKYNGCTFAQFAPIPLLQGLGIYQTGLDAIATVNQLSNGNMLKTTDPNANGQLYDTVMGIVGMREEYFPQTVIKPLPFANKVNTQEVGGGGYEFGFTLVFVGPDYQKAADNFEYAVKYAPRKAKEYLTLVHPVRGVISGVTRVTSFKRTSNLQLYNGCYIDVVFRSEECDVSTIKKRSLASQIGGAIQSTLNLITSITSTLATLQGILSTFSGASNTSPSPVVKTRSSKLKPISYGVQQKLLQSVNYIYKNSSTGASNVTLDSTPLDNTYLPKSLRYSSEYNITQGSILVDAFYDEVQSAIDEIKSYGYGGLSNNLINEFSEGLSALYQIANLSAQMDISFSYTTPYTMSIHEVLSKNGVPLDLAYSVMLKNPRLPSANYIPQGTKVYI